MKEGNHKGSPIVLFHLYEMSRIGKLSIKIASRLVGLGLGVIKGKMGIDCKGMESFWG